jgi:CubicO group peptidase (beta-lactamase class C family)
MKRLASIILILFVEILYPNHFFSKDSIINHNVLLKNTNNIIPLRNLDTLKIASLNLSSNNLNVFEKSCDNYSKLDHFHFNTFSSKTMVRAMLKELRKYNLIVIVTDTIQQEIANMINKISVSKKIILNYLGGNKLEFEDVIIKSCQAIIYDDKINNENLSYAGQVIFGGLATNNYLKTDLSENFRIGDGLTTKKSRLSYVSPKKLNINDSLLYKIDSIVKNGINNKAMPGCQILLAKDGHVFYQNSFGKHTYDSLSKKVENSDLYDLASITKIASSALILMQLESENRFNVDSTLGYYLPKILDSTDYNELIIKDVLTHQAGLAPWIPFYIKTLSEGMPSYELYSKLPSSIHKNLVAKNLYVLSSYRDSIFERIISTDVNKNKNYKYSDIGYYFVNEIIKRITYTSQDKIAENIYNKIGLHNIGYQPLEKWDLRRIAPTENDTFFRHQLIHGYVHDQGAALLGGVGGHAGLFSNANDLAVIMQMYLNKGVYGGDTIIDKRTIEKYTSSPYYNSNDNRRGIAFDKPVRNGAGGPTCFGCASIKSFGHSGFTGNLTWADPESGILYVFLSNRVYPNAENHKLISMNIRTEVMNVVAKACNYSSVPKIALPEDLH